jgi:hypothetical protein
LTILEIKQEAKKIKNGHRSKSREKLKIIDAHATVLRGKIEKFFFINIKVFAINQKAPITVTNFQLR